jgi:hypothetical protein
MATKFARIRDGLSKTAAGPEFLIGPVSGGPSTQSSVGGVLPHDRQRVAASAGLPLNDAGCRSPGGYPFDKGVDSWDGDYRSTLYNHYFAPNDERSDCWPLSPPHNPTWKAARSNHSAGVNVLMCHGSVQFVSDCVDMANWRALSTKAGNRTNERIESMTGSG